MSLLVIYLLTVTTLSGSDIPMRSLRSSDLHDSVELKSGGILSHPVVETVPMANINVPTITANGQGFNVFGAHGGGDNTGGSVSSAGDFNGDGYADLIIGSAAIRTVYVVFGPDTSDVDLLTISGSGRGFKIVGNSTFPLCTLSPCVSSVGDINGDGYGDIIVSAGGASPFGRSSAGMACVIYGYRSTIYNDINISISSAFAGMGFMIFGALKNTYLGNAVQAAGDFNGDGRPDIVIGAYGSSNYPGIVYVIFGAAYYSDIDMLTASITTNGLGLQIYGSVASDWFGRLVWTAGDVNGDGFSDIIVGATFGSQLGRTKAGTSYVIFGHSAPISDIYVNSSTFTTGGLGFQLFGATASGQCTWVSTAGDVNGDGFSDVVVGSSNTAPFDRTNAGTSFVIFGHSNSIPFNNIDLSTAISSNNLGFKIYGAAAQDNCANSVTKAGDVNNDGYADVVVTCQAGVYAAVILGHSGDSSFPDIDLSSSSFTSSGTGYLIQNFPLKGSYSGLTASYAGDVNGDGRSNIVFGIPGASPLSRNYAGQVYVIFGQRRLLPSSLYPTLMPTLVSSSASSTPKPTVAPSMLPSAKPTSATTPSTSPSTGSSISPSTSLSSAPVSDVHE